MLFKIAPEIFRDYPNTVIGVVIAQGIDNSKTNPQVKDLLQSTQDELRKSLTPAALAEHPHITQWLAAYKKFGVNPKKQPPSVKNLAERVIKKEIPSINALVDIYNIISLKYLLPAGGEDIDTLRGSLELAIAGNDEPLGLLLGDKEPTKPQAGEVLYKDDQGFVCRCWNWKEADRTKLTPSTTNAILVLEALPPVSKGLLEEAVHELGELVQKFCGGVVTVALVDVQNPEMVIKKGNDYCKHTPVQKKIEIQAHDVYAKKIEKEPEAKSPEHLIRVEKVKTMREQGSEPWPAGKEVNATAHDVIAEFDESKESRVYDIAGRVLAIREHGKTVFMVIQDRTGKVQLYIKSDDIGADNFTWMQHFIDIGDIVWATGPSFKTKMGEISIKAKSIALLSKSLHPLPEKFHGLTDVETAYRQRYLDLISNPESRERFKTRSSIVRGIRNFLDSHDFMEVETPMLQVIPGGAAARPFITHHNTLDMDLYLRIAPELYLKRLVVGGFERVYEINRNFRNEGISTRHNPEFTMLEFYIAYKDYHFAMDFVEQLLRTVAMQACKSLHIPFGAHTLDFESPFRRLSMRDAVKEYGKLSDADLLDNGINAIIDKHDSKLGKDASWGHKLLALFEKLVEPHLVQPTFITEFPIEVSPLAKRDPKNPQIAARFELFIAGVELSNGFNELNDPFDQAERFKDQAKALSAGDIEAHHYDADYVQALEYALPPTAGVGIGIDRLTMFMTNTTSIKDVILFPTLKKKE